MAFGHGGIHLMTFLSADFADAADFKNLNGAWYNPLTLD
jgi:hypothetical protein